MTIQIGNGLFIKKNLTSINYTDGKNTDRIKWLCIHYFGSLGTAQAACNHFVDIYRKASAHYFLDEGDVVWQSVEDKDIAWHCGTTDTYHNGCRNSNSLGIEVRPKILDNRFVTDASYRGWYFEDKTINNLVTFTRYLMKKYNIPIERVVRHYDVTRKLCPRPFVGDDINWHYEQTGNKMWELFKEFLKAEVKPMTGNNPSSWAKNACEKTIKLGIFKGDGNGNYDWQEPLTREQLAVILDNLRLLEDK